MILNFFIIVETFGDFVTAFIVANDEIIADAVDAITFGSWWRPTVATKISSLGTSITVDVNVSAIDDGDVRNYDGHLLQMSGIHLRLAHCWLAVTGSKGTGWTDS